MKHAYYLSEDLDELETMHDELMASGINDKHIHILSDADAEVDQHNIRPLNPLLKTDLVRSTSLGGLLGAVLALAIMTIPYVFNIQSPAGNIPFVFGAIAILGFSAWEGGLLGIQRANHKYASIDDDIHSGKHLMIVHYENEHQAFVRKATSKHPMVRPVYI